MSVDGARSAVSQDGMDPLPAFTIEVPPCPETCVSSPKDARGAHESKGSADPTSWSDYFYDYVLFRAERGADAQPSASSRESFGGDVDEGQLARWAALQNERRRAQDEDPDGAAGKGAEGGEDGLTPERIRALDSVHFPWVKCPEAQWQEMFEALVAYHEEHNNTRVPLKTGEDEAGQGKRSKAGGGGGGAQSLGKWVNSQRVMYRRGAKRSLMTAERIEKLEGLDFEWNPYKRTDWDDGLRLLEEFRAQHGHCKVGQGDNKQLYTFVRKAGRLRQKLEEGGAGDDVTAARIARLDAMGFQWTRDRKLRWEERHEELRTYKAQHGHCNVLVKHPGGLGAWLSIQRQKYERRKQGQKAEITDEQIRRLEGLGIVWSTKLDPATAWEVKFQQLKLFKEEHGHTLVRKRQGSLGQWVMDQRVQHRLRMSGQVSLLTETRVERLEGLGFQWKVQQFGKDTVKKFLEQADARQEEEWEHTAEAAELAPPRQEWHGQQDWHGQAEYYGQR